MTSAKGSDRRSGAETRAEILRVALKLFTEKGYEATSTRDLTEALGLTKSSLYYHFRNKEEIVSSLLTARHRDLDDLVGWIAAQPRTPDLPRRAARRWLDSTTPEHLQAMRLAHANQPLVRRLAADGKDVRTGFDRVIDLLADENASPQDRILLRMSFDTAGAALLAALGTDADPADILAAARRAGRALAGEGAHDGPSGSADPGDAAVASDSSDSGGSV
ncbi:TetR/AcrR family transcriptional regulator [Streptomyces sp. UNOB3_S3]|uniref:TetR/AcrR family transcriptional regulator n=1 Tax=Streptomyces sp. UNOB3_S3 TaxID=2871682 RepID=UPI001E5CB7E2|nr:TetR/AcrR family transcriptional regulator [Streptomyces sp. UNOB3_S3]MCC3774680.1 TetR/AcrR family transcriptional regulator [Streptomyces sp. UNOB3_S3]